MGAPDVEVPQIDLVVVVAVGSEDVSGLAERVTPDDKSGGMDDTVRVVVASESHPERAIRIELAGIPHDAGAGCGQR